MHHDRRHPANDPDFGADALAAAYPGPIRKV
jgi:hypothetical protein